MEQAAPETKISVVLVPKGTAAVNTPRNIKMSVKDTFAKLATFVMGKMKVTSDSCFLYYKDFAIYPDTIVGDILEHCPGATTIDIYYSSSPACG